MILDTVATTKEDDDLLLEVSFEKGKEQKEPLVAVTNDIALLQPRNGAMFCLVVDIYQQRPGPERDPRQVFDFGGHCRGKQHRLSFVFGKNLDYLSHFVLVDRRLASNRDTGIWEPLPQIRLRGCGLPRR